jgi:rsbT co-antagonist protein RsbR
VVLGGRAEWAAPHALAARPGMPIENMDARLRRLSDTLTRLLEGELAALDPYGDVVDDPLGRIEEIVQFLVMDTKTTAVANRDKEASLLMQQDELEIQQRRIRQQAADLAAKAETIERQKAAIRQLSTPILEVWDDVLVLPIIGILDTSRNEAIMADLLESIVRKRAKWAIIDITGVELADTRTVDSLLKVIRAAKLLGTSCIISGTRPDVARTLVNLGVELQTITTRRNLKDALATCLRGRDS